MPVIEIVTSSNIRKVSSDKLTAGKAAQSHTINDNWKPLSACSQASTEGRLPVKPMTVVIPTYQNKQSLEGYLHDWGLLTDQTTYRTYRWKATH